jgi:hypothetical protein
MEAIVVHLFLDELDATDKFHNKWHKMETLQFRHFHRNFDAYKTFIFQSDYAARTSGRVARRDTTHCVKSYTIRYSVSSGCCNFCYFLLDAKIREKSFKND